MKKRTIKKVRLGDFIESSLNSFFEITNEGNMKKMQNDMSLSEPEEDKEFR